MKAQDKKVPGRDTVERELHSYREEYAREFGYDIHEMFEDLREKQERSGRAVVSFPPKRTSRDARKGAV